MHAFVVFGLVFSLPSQGKRYLWNYLFCVEWDVKPQLSQSTRLMAQLINASDAVCIQNSRVMSFDVYSFPVANGTFVQKKLGLVVAVSCRPGH